MNMKLRLFVNMTISTPNKTLNMNTTEIVDLWSIRTMISRLHAASPNANLPGDKSIPRWWPSLGMSGKVPSKVPPKMVPVWCPHLWFALHLMPKSTPKGKIIIRYQAPSSWIVQHRRSSWGFIQIPKNKSIDASLSLAIFTNNSGASQKCVFVDAYLVHGYSMYTVMFMSLTCVCMHVCV